MRYTVNNAGRIIFVNTTDSLKFIRYRCNKCGKQFTLIHKKYDKAQILADANTHKCEEAAHNSRVYITPIEESFIPFEDDKELVKKELCGEIVNYNDGYFYFKENIHELKGVAKEELPSQDSKVVFVVKNKSGEPNDTIYYGIYSAKYKRWYNGFYINVAPSFRTKDIYAWNLLE